MSDFKEWLDRRCGSWTSRRRYINDMDTLKPSIYRNDFEITVASDTTYLVKYKIGKDEGSMELVLEGNKLMRDKAFLNPDNSDTYQEMFWIDPDTVVFHTAYDGTRFREEIRFLDDDHCLRQTVGRDQETNDIVLVGQYFEKRVSN